MSNTLIRGGNNSTLRKSTILFDSRYEVMLNRNIIPIIYIIRRQAIEILNYL